MAKKLVFAAAFSALLLLLAGTGRAQQTAAPTLSAAPLTIGSGDLINISMYDSPDLSGSYRVDEKGDISVPLLGLVPVEGQTAEEVGATMEKRYVEADILKPFKAHASVFIAEYATQGILVNGEVKTPGLFPALGIRMFSDVMTAAGGVNGAASTKVIIIRKSDPDHPMTVEYNPEALTPVVPKLQIFPGDTITVPRAGIVYILGKVMRPGGYVLEGRRALSVEVAMALAGGSGPAAKMSHAHLVRTLDDGRREDIILNINRIQNAKAPDVVLKDGDILFIPTDTTSLVLQQAISSALNIGTSVAIYRTAYQ